MYDLSSRLVNRFISAAALTLCNSSYATPDPEALPTTVGAPLVVAVKGKYHPDKPDGKVSFSIDASTLPWDPDKIRKSEYAAVIFDGEAVSTRICPHIDSSNRQRLVTASSMRDIQIETSASENEIKAVKAAGCLITKRITYRSIRWIPSSSAPQ